MTIVGATTSRLPGSFATAISKECRKNIVNAWVKRLTYCKEDEIIDIPSGAQFIREIQGGILKMYQMRRRARGGRRGLSAS